MGDPGAQFLGGGQGIALGDDGADAQRPVDGDDVLGGQFGMMSATPVSLAQACLVQRSEAARSLEVNISL